MLASALAAAFEFGTDYAFVNKIENVAVKIVIKELIINLMSLKFDKDTPEDLLLRGLVAEIKKYTQNFTGG